MLQKNKKKIKQPAAEAEAAATTKNKLTFSLASYSSNSDYSIDKLSAGSNKKKRRNTTAKVNKYKHILSVFDWFSNC